MNYIIALSFLATTSLVCYGSEPKDLQDPYQSHSLPMHQENNIKGENAAIKPHIIASSFMAEIMARQPAYENQEVFHTLMDKIRETEQKGASPTEIVNQMMASGTFQEVDYLNKYLNQIDVFVYFEQEMKAIATRLEEIQQSAKSHGEIDQELDAYIKTIPPENQNEYMKWLYGRHLNEKSKEILLFVLKFGDILGEYRLEKKEMKKQESKVISNIASLDRILVTSWIENPPMANEKDEEVAFKHYDRLDEVKAHFDKDEFHKIMARMMDAMSVEDQMSLARWIAYPTPPKSLEDDKSHRHQEKLKYLQQPDLGDSFPNRWGAYLWSLTAKEHMLAHQIEKHFQRARIERMKSLQNHSPYNSCSIS